MNPTANLLFPNAQKSHNYTILFLFASLLLLSQQKAEAQPQYLIQSCFTTYNYTAFSPFQNNLNRLLNRKLFNEGAISGFYNATDGEDPDKVYGLFLCRGDVSLKLCQDCIDAASQNILLKCPGNKEAIIWYEECLVRYSDRSFFSSMESTPQAFYYNAQNLTQPHQFLETLGETFENLTSVAISDPGKHMYATQEARVSDFVTLYGLVQCTPDLSALDCRDCLASAINTILTLVEGRSGVRVLQPSCNVRYELYSFHGDPRVDPPTAPPNDTTPSPFEKSKGRNSAMIALVSTSVSIFAVVLFCCVFIYHRRKKFKQEEKARIQELALLEWREGTIPDNQDFELENQTKSHDFPVIPLDVVNAATEQFSLENKLGEGGFGPVYKGTLSDGKEIAVKRLSRSSGQGLIEFKNEITLIARLQHRNLVRLLGCCLERNETLLIYEYMPNKSLDIFLFDPSMGIKLDWKRRHSIINGIARGVLYLHEDSRLRIIHRDLKASNVLLDQEMNPKISDFGMARIVGGNQIQANTNRIVGTYGYMAPEYAMEGLFSIKSDVFSFGVLLLEIISGKKNSGFYVSEHGYSLLTYAWELWGEGEGEELMDPSLVQSYSADQVLKCIHIGLLCVQEDPADRPTMSSVVLMLGNETVTLPQPKQPAFSVGRFIASSTNNSSPFTGVSSVNEVTCTNVSPR